jgi:hypothetical protein
LATTGGTRVASGLSSHKAFLAGVRSPRRVLQSAIKVALYVFHHRAGRLDGFTQLVPANA